MCNGKTLYRIRALRDFYNVKKGDIGWYVESEKNLTHDGNSWIYDNAIVCDNAILCCSAKVCENAEIYGNSKIDKGIIIGKVSMPYKDIFQHQCEKRTLTAILTEDDEILYTICCQENITKEEFINRIYNHNAGLKENLHREEYLRLILAIEMYFKGYK